MIPAAAPVVRSALSRAIAPREILTVSQWADANRRLSKKEGPIDGQWVTRRNPLLREPMDCLSRDSGVHDLTIVLPIQFGKTSIELNALGYTMDHDPCPIMVVLPDDLTKDAWTLQKFNPMLDSTPAVQRALSSTASRDTANQRAFKDFAGGQLFIEHGKTATRLALRTVKRTLVDELDKFLAALQTGEDPIELLKGRNSAFPSTYQRCFIGSPGILGVSRLWAFWLESDQRSYHVPCPHCSHEQPLVWSGLHWTPDHSQAWYCCRECGAVIEEGHKAEMIERGRWVAARPEAKTRGYHANCLYYPIGLGPRWLDLVHMWRDAQNDPAKLQVFVQERLAEPWEDQSMRAVKHNVIADRAEPYKLRTAPLGVLSITAGVDTQDNRLCVTIIGWGRGMACWVLDYVELPGDPAQDDVWISLIELLSRPIEHVSGALMRCEAVAIDAGGHRTEDVKAFVRARRVRRPICIFGAVPNNAPILSKGKLQDVNWRGQLDKRGVHIHHVGTVDAKHRLYARLSADHDKPSEARLVHFSDELPREYFAGLVSETYNPAKNRFEKRTGARNEPLDTWVYAYAAAHHPELRLHRRTPSEWDLVAAQIVEVPRGTPQPTPVTEAPRGTSPAPVASPPAAASWKRRW